jgi:hypothetical protein
MRTALTLLALLMVGCIDAPSMKETDPLTGVVLEYKMGRNFMGKQEEFVSHIKGPNGREIFASWKKAETEEVAKMAIGTAGLAVGQITTGKVDMHNATQSTTKTVNASNNAVKTTKILSDEKVQLGGQEVTKAITLPK